MSFGFRTAHRTATTSGLLAGLLVAAPVATSLAAAAPATAARPPAAASHGGSGSTSAADDGRRRIVRHTVRPGDTVTGLAVRFHAWTDELIRLNRLGPAATIRIGQSLRIPVVVSRAGSSPARPGPAPHSQPTRPTQPAQPTQTHERQRIRRLIERTARAYGVDPHLALAVSWQEAGWRMHHVSSAGAIGAMQVLPSTGRWMSLYVGRSLDLRHARDNVAAGVMLLKVLREMTGSERQAIGAYYQGIGSVLRDGLDPGTRAYLANVRAIERRLERGLPPAG